MNIFISGKADRQHVQALVTCKQVAGLIPIFEKLLVETQASLVDVDDVVRVHRLQGRAQVLRDFLEAVNDAPQVLERLR